MKSKKRTNLELPKNGVKWQGHQSVRCEVQALLYARSLDMYIHNTKTSSIISINCLHFTVF